MSATLSGWLSLTPLLSRSRATIAASEIISLSFSRGVRFMNFSVLRRSLAGPHFRYSEGSRAELWSELLEKAAQGKLQIRRLFRGKADDDQSAYQRHCRIAFQGRNNLAQKILSLLWIRPEIDQCCNRLTVREQGLPGDVGKDLIGDA